MGMPITIEIIDQATKSVFDELFTYFKQIDARYSTYKPQSEVSLINSGLPRNKWSDEIKSVLKLCDETKQLTDGYFDVYHDGRFDPSGLVKGWAIHHASEELRGLGFENFYVEAGGDIQVSGHNEDKQPWSVGIRNPFNIDEIIKVIRLTTEGIATSGTYIRGQHIYNPHGDSKPTDSVKSFTVIGPDIYEADRFATAAFAMGKKGIAFIQAMPHLEGYTVDSDKVATYTSGFERYLARA